MELISDALLIAGAVGAAAYCRLLAKRLGALKELDSGLGAAIAALSRQVDELRASLESAKSVSGEKAREISQLTARAEMAAGRLELLLASLHENGSRRPIEPRAERGAERGADHVAARAAGLKAAAREDAAARLAEIAGERDEEEPRAPASRSPAQPEDAPLSPEDLRAALRWAAERRAAGGGSGGGEFGR